MYEKRTLCKKNLPGASFEFLSQRQRGNIFIVAIDDGNDGVIIVRCCGSGYDGGGDGGFIYVVVMLLR